MSCLLELNKIDELEIRENEPLSRYTGFRTGGNATVLVPHTEKSFTDAVGVLKKAGTSYFVLGNGTNVIAKDEGYPGYVLKTSAAFSALQVNGNSITAGSGVSLIKVCRLALEKSLTGLEFAYGIPGSVGGAVYMNAGAYGGEIKDILTFVTVLDSEGCVREMKAEELKLSYRYCLLHDRRDLVILSAVFALQPGIREDIEAKMKELMGRRIDKQPLEYPSCGSTFKRPKGSYASKLIDECGLRGFRVGGAQVSEKHCGFVINRENATSSDIFELCRQVRQIVMEKTGYDLEFEIEVM